jgi:hypothetical protein
LTLGEDVLKKMLADGVSADPIFAARTQTAF